MQTNITIERRGRMDVVSVTIEGKDTMTTTELLREAARALNIEVIKNERSNSSGRSNW